jgi:hypothetical protein
MYLSKHPATADLVWLKTNNLDRFWFAEGEVVSHMIDSSDLLVRVKSGPMCSQQNCPSLLGEMLLRVKFQLFTFSLLLSRALRWSSKLASHLYILWILS